MEPRREDTDLATELRELRPTPRPDFVAELDARAAAGFPAANGEEAGPSLSHRLAERLGRLPRRRLPALAATVAVAAIAVATAVVAISEDETVTSPAERFAGAPERLDRTVPLDRTIEGPPVQYSAQPRALGRAAGGSAAAGGSGGSPSLHSGEATAAEGTAADGAAANLRASGPNAFLTSRRDVERSARLVLATEPSQVRAAAARVFETVHAYDGIVLRSSILAGDDSEASAVFELLIPSGKLGDALAGFSEIADVRSRQEATGDVTGRTTGLEERLRESRARIEGLLGELAGADTEAERGAVERELRFERRRLAALRAALQGLERRVNLSRVSLRIESGSPHGDDGDGSWGVADAFDDAGRILAIAAGVTLIGLAVLAPLALIAALAWLAGRALARRRREGVLD